MNRIVAYITNGRRHRRHDFMHYFSFRYWPDLLNALIKVSMDRGVEVRILVSHWAHTSPQLPQFMKAIRLLNGINGAILRVVRHTYTYIYLYCILAVMY